MNKQYKILIPALLTLMFALVVNIAGAQVSNLISSGVILSVSPENPRAGQEVRITARSLSFDVSRASFRWYTNEKLFASGVGVNNITVKAGPAGSTISIRVAATTPDGITIETSAGVNITDIDFIIYSPTYTPLFYRGSPLPTPGGKVEIIAVPFLYFDGSRLDPASLFYEWYIGGQKLAGESGEGRDKLELKLFDAISSYDISVKISSRSKIVNSVGSVRFNVYQPEVLFYNFNNLTGFWNYASNLFAAADDSSVSISAEPYYFDLGSFSGAVLEWSADRAKIEPGEENPRLLNINIPKETIGRKQFAFKIEKPRSIFQRAESSLILNIFKLGE